MNNRVVLAAVAVVIAAIIGWRFNSARGGNEGNGGPLAQVTVPALAGEAKEGEALFNANCASCHGENAAGRNGAGPPFIHVIYQPGHHGDASFHLAARNGAVSHHWNFGDMPPVKSISDEEVAKIVTYVRTLQRANGID